MNRHLDRALNPACLAHERRPRDYFIILLEIVVIFVVITIFWPSPWLLLLAPFIGICLVTHPGCFLTHYKHKGRFMR